MSVKVTAKMVKKLRNMTGAGMMDCKKALVATGGNFDDAVDFLRKKGQKLSAKRADREAKEGVVVALTTEDNTRGVAVNLSCETDFVAKNADFVDFAKSITTVALTQNPANLEELLALELDGMSIKDKVIEQIGVIGEKLEVSKYERLEAPTVVAYIHMGYKLGVLVGLNQAGEAVTQAGKNVAMQIAAMSPIAVDRGDVPKDMVKKETEIAVEKAAQDKRNAGKPRHILERIAIGMVNKFYKEKTLLNQIYVKGSNKENVKKYLQSINKKLTVTGFKRVTLGS